MLHARRINKAQMFVGLSPFDEAFPIVVTDIDARSRHRIEGCGPLEERFCGGIVLNVDRDVHRCRYPLDQFGQGNHCFGQRRALHRADVTSSQSVMAVVIQDEFAVC